MQMLPRGPDTKPSRESPCLGHIWAGASKSLLSRGVFLHLVPQLCPLLLPAASLAWHPWLLPAPRLPLPHGLPRVPRPCC